MDESSSRDLELLLLAVQQGALSNSQVEECLRDWEEKHGVTPGLPATPLPSVAIKKGFLTEHRLKELAAKSARTPDQTAIRFQVVMSCRECRETVTLDLEAALKKP